LPRKSAEDKAGDAPKPPPDFILRLSALLEAQIVTTREPRRPYFRALQLPSVEPSCQSLVELARSYISTAIEQLGMQAIEAIRPLHVASRAHFITFLAKRGLLRKEVFLDYILASRNDACAELRKAAVKALESAPPRTAD
jgi:hypothetical protein